MFENPRRGRQARNFATKVSKILDLKSSSEQIFFRKLSLGAPVYWRGSLRRRHSESLYRPGGGGGVLRITSDRDEWGQNSKPLIPCVRFSTLNNRSLLGGIYLSSPCKGVHPPPPPTQVTVMLLGFTNNMKQWRK